MRKRWRNTLFRPKRSSGQLGNEQHDKSRQPRPNAYILTTSGNHFNLTEKCTLKFKFSHYWRQAVVSSHVHAYTRYTFTIRAIADAHESDAKERQRDKKRWHCVYVNWNGTTCTMPSRCVSAFFSWQFVCAIKQHKVCTRTHGRKNPIHANTQFSWKKPCNNFDFPLSDEKTDNHLRFCSILLHILQIVQNAKRAKF